MNLIHSRFFKSPTKIYDLNLSSSELLVLSYLFSLSDNILVHPSKTTIALKTKLGKRTVDRAINTLVSKGFLEYNRGFKKENTKMCNQYRICVEKIDPNCLIKPKELLKENDLLEKFEFDTMIRNSIQNYGST